MTTTTDHTNRLANETSPYLLQHAHNPVNWYPWGDAAFEKAKAEDKPVFLSIGYSTCHWCHVMAHESFEDDDIAAVLNAGFVSIKVDREERPDIDEVYMNVCQAMTGSGGWPLTVIMTPDKKPFFAGTYLPRTAAYRRMGLIELLGRVSVLWQTDRQALIDSGEQITAALNAETGSTPAAQTDIDALITAAQSDISHTFDKRRGGFSHAPKFPMPHYLAFLLFDWARRGDSASLDMAEKTLTQMYSGGIFDHVGGGFARYATDSNWLVPHFEKMLYDNAGLLRVYAQCYAATGKDIYRDVVHKIAAYVMRDMQDSGGGFYSAEDADSEGVEGKFYVWDYDELKAAMNADELRFLEMHYGVSPRGNFEGKNIINMTDALPPDAQRADVVLKKLYDRRIRRVPPFKDTKISASWNGMMIDAMACAGMMLEMPAYIDSARKAADFILGNMTDENGRMCGIYKDGLCGKHAFLADYTNMAGALITLYTATRDTVYLEKASVLARQMTERFYDANKQRFYMTAKGDEALLTRPRDDYDGAMVSGASSAIMALVRLYHLTGRRDAVPDGALEAAAGRVSDSPRAHIHLISALMLWHVPHRQIVIAARAGRVDAEEAYRDICRRFLPFTTVVLYNGSSEMDRLMPHLMSYKTDKPFSAYVCENFACRQPVYSCAALMGTLGLKT